MNLILENETKLDKAMFESYYNWFKNEGDLNNASKILEIYEKLSDQMQYICFTGHFSAGKSSLINYMVDDDVLPKSPVPTSANIVKLFSGEGSVKVVFKDKKSVIYREPYDIDIIKDYATDRGSIKELQLYLNNDFLNKKTVLMDTPGIDAADDADRFMTESVLHLIDELFYVMDYNHVQSEVNLYFLQQISKLNIPIHLVINQIDKHNEDELSFEMYKRTIEQTFEQWRIKPDTMHFTSTKYLQHPLNQVDDLKLFLKDKMAERLDVKLHVSNAVTAIAEDHKKYLETLYTVDNADEISDETITKGKEISDRLEVLDHLPDLIKKDFSSEMSLTLKNAYLMPASLRDIVESFLESEQDNFKIGGLFNSRKKTLEEKVARRNKFISVLQETAKTTIEWKLKEKLHTIFKDYHASFDEISDEIQNINIEIPDSIIDRSINPGAKVTGNYVLNYSNDVSHEVKQYYRSKLNKELVKIIALHHELSREEYNQLSEQLNKMGNVKSLLNQESEKKSLLNAKLDDFLNINVNEENDVNLGALIADKNKATVETQPTAIVHEVSPKSYSQFENETIDEATVDTQVIIDSINKITQVLEGNAGFQRLRNELIKRKNAIKNRALTIALFGTFSAGKSSFSNALFGEKILPVSPNPTTAVISKIKPITNKFPHGTVIIKNKSESEMIADITNITKYIIDEEKTYTEWIKWLARHKISEDSRLSKVYQSYISAILKGNEEQQASLGSEVKITLDQFGDYVTDESKACFIKEVELYYDNAITQKGITIVDTPGADSVNARHTNVAFDYIKDADAIIYVTYYNHAITRGDRDFLKQLGRVKGSFEMDKMFFIVNAADLAENDDELSMVVNYVNDQLVQFGIKNAKIFPVSSKGSLADKLSNNTLNPMMSAFEHAFYQFIEKDLIKLLIEGALWDVKRVKNTINEFIHSLNYSEADRQKKVSSIKQAADQAYEVINAQDTSSFEKRLMERINRQLHFVEERFSIRFNDMFQSFFNPGQIKDSGKKGREQVVQARNELIEYSGYELLQEIRAVALRMESLLRNLQKDANENIQKELLALNDMFALSQIEVSKTETPAFKQAFDSFDLSSFDKSIKKYKNTKSFFANDGVDLMRQEFFDIMQPESKTYIEKNQSLMLNYYTEEWQRVDREITQNQLDEIQEIVNEYVEIINDHNNLNKLKEMKEKIDKASKHLK